MDELTLVLLDLTGFCFLLTLLGFFADYLQDQEDALRNRYDGQD